MLCYELSLHIAEEWDTAAVQEQHFPEVKMEIAMFIRTSKTRNKNISDQGNVVRPNWDDTKMYRPKSS